MTTPELLYRDVSGKKCLACQRSLVKVDGVLVMSRASDGWEDTSTTLTLHKTCIVDELLAWLLENGMVQHGDLVVTMSFSKLENIFQQPKLQAMVKSAMERNRRSQALYTEETNGAFYRTKRWKRIADTIRRDHRYKCFRCKRKERKELPVHHLDWNIEHNAYENLIPVCDACHRYFHERISLEELPKYLTKTLAGKLKETKDEGLRVVYQRLYTHWSRQRVGTASQNDDPETAGMISESQYGFIRDLLTRENPAGVKAATPVEIFNYIQSRLVQFGDGVTVPPPPAQSGSDPKKEEHMILKKCVSMKSAGRLIDELRGKKSPAIVSKPTEAPVEQVASGTDGKDVYGDGEQKGTDRGQTVTPSV